MNSTLTSLPSLGKFIAAYRRLVRASRKASKVVISKNQPSVLWQLIHKTCLFTLISATSLHATTFTVNSLTDTKPTTGGNGSATSGDLRYCITQANNGAYAVPYDITFTVTGKITLAGRDLSITRDLTISGPGRISLTIDGNNASRIFYISPGHTVTLSGLTIMKGNGSGSGRGGGIYNNNSTLTLNACTVSDCTDTLSGASSMEGGGICSYANGSNAVLNINNSTITGNNGWKGGGIYNYALGSGTATLNLSGTTVSNNTGGYGGGIESYGLGTAVAATITNSTITGNTASGNFGGGGIMSQGDSANGSSSMTITNSVISNNRVTVSAGFSYPSGGGILNGGGTNGPNRMYLTDCTISGNTSDWTGGGVTNMGWTSSTQTMLLMNRCTVSGNQSKGSGGGIFNTGGGSFLEVNNSTIASNTVSGTSGQQRGGGIRNQPSGNGNMAWAKLTNSTISGNAAVDGGGGIANDLPSSGSGNTAYLILANTLLALNPTGANFSKSGGTGLSSGYNLCDDNSASALLTATGDKNNQAAGLQVDGSNKPVLQNNGGLTSTIALLPTSLAIDAGKAADDWVSNAPATTDQRSSTRPFDIATMTNAVGGDGSDIGAFELTTHSLALSGSPANYGSVSGAGTKLWGSTVITTATPDSGYVFENWTESGAVVSTSASYSFTQKEDRTLMANFRVATPAHLQVEQPVGRVLVNGTSTVDFGSVTLPTSGSQTFTLRNTGEMPLLLGTIMMDGDQAGDFGISTSPGTIIEPGAITTLTIAFTPGATGLRVAAIHLPSNDASSPFDVPLTGTGIALPALSTVAASNLTAVSATLTGTTHPHSSSATVTFEYGLTTSYGLTAAATPSPVTGNAAMSVSAAISGLAPSTLYHFRLKGVNAVGTDYSPDVIFMTPSNIATLSNLTVSSGTLVPAFNSMTTAYAMLVPGSTSSLTFTPTTMHAQATAQVTGPAALGFSGNLFNVAVTAEDGITTRICTITVLRLPFVTVPAEQITALGSQKDIVATVAGAVSQKWKKNNVDMALATGTTLSIASAALTDAAIYSLTATNTAGSTTSVPATRLAVVKRTLSALTVIKGGTISYTVTAAAPTGMALSYQWFRGNAPLANGTAASGAIVAGATTSKLTITKATKAEQAAYTCRITMGSASLDTLPGNVTEINPPSITTTTVPAAAVSVPFSWQLASDENPTSFAVSGLPSVIAASAAGLISGTPNVSGTFKLKVSAKNRAGTGAIQEFTLIIDELPTGTAGTFTGLLTRDTSINGSLGGWIKLDVASTGTFTGSLKNGTASYPLSGRLLASLTGNPTVALPIKRSTPLPALTLSLICDGANNTITGTLADSSATAFLDGRRNVWSGSSAASSAASYNASIDVPAGSENDAAQPLGTGWQQMTVTAAGAASGIGRTADGVSYSFSGGLWPDRALPQFVLLYSNHGSLIGLPQIATGATVVDNRVTGWVEQIKTAAASTKDRTYNTCIPLLRRVVDGAPWVKPTTASPVVLGLPDAAANARIIFTKGDVESSTQFASLAQTFRINKNNTTTFAAKTSGNPCGVTMTIIPSTGLFSGKLTLTDTVSGKAVPRIVDYAGILLSHRSKGSGYFLLPGLSVSTTTAPILGGRIEVTP